MDDTRPGQGPRPLCPYLFSRVGDGVLEWRDDSCITSYAREIFVAPRGRFAPQSLQRTSSTSEGGTGQKSCRPYRVTFRFTPDRVSLQMHRSCLVLRDQGIDTTASAVSGATPPDLVVNLRHLRRSQAPTSRFPKLVPSTHRTKYEVLQTDCRPFHPPSSPPVPVTLGRSYLQCPSLTTPVCESFT